MSFECRPIPRDNASQWASETHRHLRRPVTGWLFGIEILCDGVRVGVAMCGRPKARGLQDGLTCEITRVAISEGHPNACSFAYGALRKAAAALGYRRVYTYTRVDEPGVSPRAAGFVLDGVTRGGEWDCPARSRGQAEDPTPKNRWVWPATARKVASS